MMTFITITAIIALAFSMVRAFLRNGFWGFIFSLLIIFVAIFLIVIMLV